MIGPTTSQCVRSVTADVPTGTTRPSAMTCELVTCLITAPPSSLLSSFRFGVSSDISLVSVFVTVVMELNVKEGSFTSKVLNFLIFLSLQLLA